MRYATDPTQAAQLLLSGQVENAVLSEALATAVILQTKDTAKPLHRAMAFDKAWIDASGGETPIAGTVATASVLGRPDVIVAFERDYKAAVQWMLDNPEEAGKLVETQLPQLGLKARGHDRRRSRTSPGGTRPPRTPGPTWTPSTRISPSSRRK